MSADPTQTLRCAQCGGEMAYQPGTAVVRCPFCRAETAIDAPAGPAAEAELDYAEHLAAMARQADRHEALASRCGGCGAEVAMEASVASMGCPFCGSHVVSEAARREVIRPQWVLPFAVARPQAHAAVQQWLSGRWFAPGTFTRLRAEPSLLAGLYVPFWTYDCRTTADYRGQRGEHYWASETYHTLVNGRSVTRTRQVRRTRWYPAGGVVANTFDDLLVPASRSLPAACVERLQPWDLSALTAYDGQYLAGFRAELYQVGLEEGFAAARQMMMPTIEATIRRDIGGDEQRIDHLNLRCRDITFKHLLCPVWVAACRHGGRTYRILVNARTGQVQGERPWSVAKIVLLVLGIAAAAAIVAVAMSS